MSEQSDNMQNDAAANLRLILEEEREKRVKAEQTAQALIEEFTNCNDFEEVRKKFRDKIRDIAPQALTNIVTLMNTAESESVRSSLNKWVLEWAMSDKIDNSGSELNELISALKKQPTSNTQD